MPKRKAETSAERESRLFCVCRQPNDSNKVMVRCDYCDEWFHPACVNIDEDEAASVDKWYCPGCIDLLKQNPMISKQGLLGFQGRVAPKEGWTNQFPLEDLDESIISVDTKRHRNEGYNLFRENKVVSVSSCTVGNNLFFRAQCLPAMKSDKPYTIYICLKSCKSNSNFKQKWSTCSCPAGIDGKCKHCVAVLYCLIDFTRQGVTELPNNQTCTGKLQMWHVRKPLTDDPLLFKDITFIKHDPDHIPSRELSCSARYHNPTPAFAKAVTRPQIEKLCMMSNAKGTILPVIRTLENNSAMPVRPKQQSTTSLQSYIFDAMRTTSFDIDISSYTSNFDLFQDRYYRSTVLADVDRSMQIEKRTRLQSKSSFWFEQRACRITSSSFGTFIKMKDSTDRCATFVRTKTCFKSSSVQHGNIYENAALAKFCSTNECLDCPVGLIVNPALPFLGASPDRIILQNEVVKLIEIKCPYSLYRKKKSINSMVGQKDFFLYREDGVLKLKESHDYYFQIQGQLNLTGINQCVLVVFVPPEDMVTVTINRDTDFFNKTMLPKLCSVWFEHVFPYLFSQL